MVITKYIVVTPCLFADGLFLSEEDAVVRPAYFNSATDALECIADFCGSNDEPEDIPLEVEINTEQGTIIDASGKNWAVELKSQVLEALAW